MNKVNNDDEVKNLIPRKYLRITTAMTPITTLQICFWGLLIFSLGMIMGFSINKFGLKPCYLQQPKMLPVADVQRKISPESASELGEKKNEIFTELPEKYLKYVKMNPPASVFSLLPFKTAVPVKPNEKPYFTVFLVKTAAPLVKRRFLVRRTWSSIETINKERLGLVFLVGMTKTPPEQELLNEENALYGDILQGDIPDTYRALPSKTLMGHQWIAQYFMNSTRFVTLTDDDCFISVVNMYDYFNNIPPTKSEDGVHCGFIYSHKAQPVRKLRSKWYISEEIYNVTKYPVFCHGGMTVMNPHISADIYRVSLVTNYTGMHLEDVLTNGILRHKLKENGYGSEKVFSIFYVNKEINKRLPMMWHLGNRKTIEEQFVGLWTKAKLRFHETNNRNDGSFSDFNRYRFNVTLRDFPTKPDIKSTEMSNYFESMWENL